MQLSLLMVQKANKVLDAYNVWLCSVDVEGAMLLGGEHGRKLVGKRAMVQTQDGRSAFNTTRCSDESREQAGAHALFLLLAKGRV